MKRSFNLKKAIVIMVVITLVQSLSVATLAVVVSASARLRIYQPELAGLLLLALLSAGGSMFTIISVKPIINFNLKLSQTENTIKDLSELNNTLRAQRHDFLNHLQVVYSLMELNEFSEAGNYIEKVYTDIQKVSRILKTKIPAVNAILQAKAQMCERRGIEVTIDVRSTLSDTAIPEWELCRVLGNIIDNSIHALVEAQAVKEKRLRIEIFENLKNHGFRITNNGPAIPQHLWEDIFEAGFTTRGANGDGMGLAICRDIMDDCKGTLKVYSDDKKTVFEGLIPRSC